MTTDPKEADRELVRRCILREEAAWQEWIDRFGPRIRGVCAEELRRAGQTVSEELLDELSARVYEKLLVHDCRVLKSFRWDASLSAWLSRVARSIALSYLRSEAARRIRQEKQPPAGTVSPAQSPEGESKNERLARAIAELPAADREALDRLYLNGETHRAIAESLGVPIGTFSARITRLKRRLRQILRSSEESSSPLDF